MDGGNQLFLYLSIRFVYISQIYITVHPIFSGEIAFNTDIIRQLRAQSQTNRKAYAYYFTNLIQYPPFVKPWYFPAWLKRSADHTDEVPFVFGAILAKDNYTALVNGEPDQFYRGRVWVK